MSEVLLRLPQVRERCGLSRSEIYWRVAARQFPVPVRLGVRAVAWKSGAIEAWIADRAPKGREAAA
jgi:prophage regulatory protein